MRADKYSLVLPEGLTLPVRIFVNGDAACLTAETGIEKSLNIFKPRHKNYRAACDYNNGVGFASATAATSALCSAGISIPSLS